YYHTNSTAFSNQVPTNLIGTQSPNSGNAYSGIITYCGMCADYREYIRVQLNAPLITGTSYIAQMYVSLADSSYRKSNNLGMLFTTNSTPLISPDCSLDPKGVMLQPIGSQLLNNTNVQSNYTGWTLISFTFTASGNHTFLFIGNFFNDASTILQPGLGAWNVFSANSAYYYIDDISVTSSCVGPTLTVAGSNSICAGQSTTLSASGATTYSWNTGATTTVISVSPPSTTVYTLSGYNGNCSSSQTAIVNVLPLPIIDPVTSALVICNGIPVTLSVSGALAFTWQPGNLNGAVVNFSPTATQVYTCSGTNINGCVATETILITVIICTGELLIAQESISFYVYPNPAQTEINFSEELMNVEIYNAIGQKVISEIKPVKNISVSELSNGFYYINHKNGNIKFIVQH
ncbi:MAG: T9SS type A sorting domain-containing protein, partial [Bacteroidota bacterium]|nr:T9SS type A sorting domain-containing protein [Bacteroidota bacterium]